MYNSGSSREESICFIWTSSETHSSPDIGNIADNEDIGYTRKVSISTLTLKLPTIYGCCDVGIKSIE